MAIDNLQHRDPRVDKVLVDALAWLPLLGIVDFILFHLISNFDYHLVASHNIVQNKVINYNPIMQCAQVP